TKVLVDTYRMGRHRRASSERVNVPHRRPVKLTAMIVAVAIALMVIIGFAVYIPWHSAGAGPSSSQRQHLSTGSASYIGLYARGVPASYAPVKAFTASTGVKPNMVVYYSGWMEPFQAQFAATAASKGAVPLVQINPTRVSIADIAGGKYDTYLTA